MIKIDVNEYWNRGYESYLSGSARVCNHTHSDMDQAWLRGYDVAKGQRYADDDDDED